MLSFGNFFHPWTYRGENPACRTKGSTWLLPVFFLGCVVCAAPGARGESWIFQPSYFSHNDQGGRVAQFSQPPQIALPYAPNYVVSGYRHTRATIRGAESYDHLHIVKTWGLGAYIRPYEEWEFPFRPGATPFGPWGNPQGPWTLPFQSWVNPFALGQLPNPPWWLYFPWTPGLMMPPLSPPAGGSGNP
ncbi:MAG: hypothetical protein H5U08_13690 [Thermogutta sp.]|uniref:hypothetical protein n=1 Tax=Thermogutta sp. TaxID=1962930 RepID=UPI001990E2EC|nr:hypothetical protein [Thermogutta sp.]MBC7353408.1 hypothetical protein [Thermogutta sp.]